MKLFARFDKLLNRAFHENLREGVAGSLEKKEERVSFYVWIPKKNQQHERPASRAARVRADTGKIP